jgi:hypothetical protein
MTVYVRCKVLPGLFDSEYLVEVVGSSAFVSRQNVRALETTPRSGNEVNGEVLAYLLDRSQDSALIELPGEPVVGGLRTRVPSDALVAA